MKRNKIKYEGDGIREFLIHKRKNRKGTDSNKSDKNEKVD